VAVKQENISGFMIAMFNMMQIMKRKMGDCCDACGDLSEREFLIVTFVGQKQNVKMSDIAEAMSAPMSTLTSIVDKLVDKGYLARYNSIEDRRVVMVTLAKRGNEAHNKFLDQKENLVTKVLLEFSSEEQEEVIKNLEKITVALNKSD
jgi:DNA-binding MarR family transcriptional regulator